MIGFEGEQRAAGDWKKKAEGFRGRCGIDETVKIASNVCIR